MTLLKKKQNYLNNKDLLKEIHISKLSYCWTLNPKYQDYNIILHQDATILTFGQTKMGTHKVKKKGKEEFTEETFWPDPTLQLSVTRKSVEEIIDQKHIIQEAKQNQATKITKANYDIAIAAHNTKDYKNKPRQKDFSVNPNTIALEDLTFRVHTYEHIPEEIGRKNIPKKEGDYHIKLNFPPFKQFAFINNKLTEVVRSHWDGDLLTGQVSTNIGRLTSNLGMMFLKLAERYSHLSNWRNYTYVDEMRGSALLRLASIGLQFDESKSDNPFAYYTTSIKNDFTKVLNVEKKNQDMRDDILTQHGLMPSFSRQLEHEEQVRILRNSTNDDDLV